MPLMIRIKSYMYVLPTVCILNLLSIFVLSGYANYPKDNTLRYNERQTKELSYP